MPVRFYLRICAYCVMAQVLSLGSLDSYSDYDFTLLSIVSSVRSHKLVWEINERLEIRLKKYEDILFDFKDGSGMSISNYLFETEHTTVELFENRAVEVKGINKPYLLPELKEYDYFFKFGGNSDLFVLDDLLEDMKSVSSIQYVTEQEVGELTSRDNLIT